MPRRPQIQRPLYCLYKSLLRAALVPFVVAVAAASELPSERLECENIKSNATFSGSSGLVLAAFDGFLDALVGFNGIYDMGCCIAILTLPLWRISTLHISVFSDDLGNIGSMLWHRLLAYWIFTYGIARFASAVVRHPALDGISAATYLIEAITYGAETWTFRATLRNGAAVSILSFVFFALQGFRSAFRLPQAIAELKISDQRAPFVTGWICFAFGLVVSIGGLGAAIEAAQKPGIRDERPEGTSNPADGCVDRTGVAGDFSPRQLHRTARLRVAHEPQCSAAQTHF